VIPVTFTAGNNPGKIHRKIRIETDIGGKKAEVTAFGQILSPLAGG